VKFGAEEYTIGPLSIANFGPDRSMGDRSPPNYKVEIFFRLAWRQQCIKIKENLSGKAALSVNSGTSNLTMIGKGVSTAAPQFEKSG